MIKIIMDGSADMPEGWADVYQFDILPIPIQIGGKTYYQGEDITPELFYDLVKNDDIKPQTAAPSPSRIKEYFEKICKTGDTVLFSSVSSKLSSTFTMVNQAARELADKINVVTCDSLAGSAVLALMAKEARLHERAGESLESILAIMKVIRNKVMVVLTLDSLEFARRSGRIGLLKAALTSFLNIKPIIILKEGLMEMSDMVRSRKKSLERLVMIVKKRFGEERVLIAVVHSQDRETAEKLSEMLKSVMNIAELVFTDLSISVAANLDSRTVGIVAIPGHL